ncbi:MAG: hypothetical protein KA742_17265, partial [Pseudoxanthomonas sp.]|nr:hypothetical protein [Pseudoxanthomonas sp.]
RQLLDSEQPPHWTKRRRLSNVARGAAEGLEGPAGTERLDPTQKRRPAPEWPEDSFPSQAVTPKGSVAEL